MPRPTSKYTISGTRHRDEILVFADGYVRTTEGKPPELFTPVDPAIISAGVVVKGGASDDVIRGGPGADDLYGDAGNDRLAGGDGLDRLFGGADNDTLSDSLTGAYFDGGRGIDTLDFSVSVSGVAVYSASVETGVTVEMLDGSVRVTHSGDEFANRIFNIETLVGSNHNDVLWAGNGSDTIRGGGGDDYLNGLGLGGDLDALFGDGGKDLLLANSGIDHMTGGAGADRFAFDITTMNQGQDIVFDYSAAEGDLLVFSFAETGPSWAGYSYNSPNDSLIGTWSSPSGQGSVILVGISDPATVNIQVTGAQYVYDYYL